MDRVLELSNFECFERLEPVMPGTARCWVEPVDSLQADEPLIIDKKSDVSWLGAHLVWCFSLSLMFGPLGASPRAKRPVVWKTCQNQPMPSHPSNVQ